MLIFIDWLTLMLEPYILPLPFKKGNRCMKAKCLGMEYFPGGFSLHSGVNANRRNNRSGSGSFRNRGTGWGENKTPSELHLYVEVEGQQASMRTENIFHLYLGSLTQRRIEAIKKAMPEEVDLDIINGKVSLVVSESEVIAWLKRAGLSIKRQLQ